MLKNYTSFFGDIVYEIIILFAGLIGALATQEIRIRYEQGPVKSSACVSLICGLICYFLPLDYGIEKIIRDVPTAVMGGSFVAMSSNHIIPNRRWMIVAALIFSSIFLFSSAALKGFGGALGTTACVAVIITKGINLIKSKLLK